MQTAHQKEKLNDIFGAGRAYESAGGICDGKGPGGPAAAADYWTKAIRAFRLSGKTETASKLLLKVAEVQEKQGNQDGAKAAFDEAVEVFQDEEKNYCLGDIYKQYIAFLVRSGRFEEATRVIDGHVELLVKQRDHSFAHKELLGKAVLHLHCGDTVRAEQALSPGIDVKDWYMSKECLCGSQLVAAFQAMDAEEAERVLKEQTINFLQVEIARLAKKLKVHGVGAPAAPPVGVVASAEPPPPPAAAGSAANAARNVEEVKKPSVAELADMLG